MSDTLFILGLQQWKKRLYEKLDGLLVELDRNDESFSVNNMINKRIDNLKATIDEIDHTLDNKCCYDENMINGES